MELKDITGQRFNRLLVLKRVENIRTSAAWLCKCDCGNEIVTTGVQLRSGHTKSCNCLQKETIGNKRRKHGRSGTRLYKVWKGMRERCNNPNNISYKNYGGRGIVVCERWQNSFDNFLEDMGERPATIDSKFTIDRIDVNGNYEPGNCEWKTYIEQGKNTRRNVWIEYNGEKKIISEWGKELNLPHTMIKNAIKAGELNQLFDKYANNSKSRGTI